MKILHHLKQSAFWVLLFFMLGCAGIMGFGTTNWTRYFQNNPEKLEEYPHLVGTPILGGVYELKKDRLLIGTSGRDRYRVTNFGVGGLPHSVEDYHAGKGREKNVYGVVESGTRIRGERVEKYVSSSPSVPMRQGVIYEIIDGPHKGKMLAGGPNLIKNSNAGSYDKLDPAMLEQRPDPELVRQIKSPHLDIRGEPIE